VQAPDGLKFTLKQAAFTSLMVRDLEAAKDYAKALDPQTEFARQVDQWLADR